MFPTLLAADIWTLLVPAVFFVIYLINQLMNGKNAVARQREMQERRRAAQAGQAERPLPAPERKKPGQSQLNAEIEQFLKRANERRLEKTRRTESPQSAAARPASAPQPKAPIAQLTPPAAPLREQPADVLPLELQDFNSVSASVEQHLGNRGFEKRAEHMVDDMVQADAARERHFQQVFDHRLGNFGKVQADPLAPVEFKPPPPRPADPAGVAHALAGVLATPQDLRRAILLKEILERPVDRW